MALLKRADLSRFQKHIEAGDYGSALKLADKFGLDKDDVYKPQWNASDFGTDAIRDILSRIDDSMWVVKECQDRVCPSFEAMNALLSCGLRFTDRHGNSSLDEGAASDKDWWFRFKRLRLLQYKDRLDTFVGISNGRYSQSEYEIFRAAALHKVALGFAERGKTGALSLLVKRHTYSLAPFILQILNAIPEPLSPQTYGQLLPNVASPKPHLPRKSGDWVEKEAVLKAVKAGRKGSYQGEKELPLEESTEYMVKLSKGLLWPTKAEIVGWYKERAKEIDRSCGLLENSLALLDLGVGKGLTELEAYFEDVSDLYGVVYSGGAIDSEVDLRLSDWERLGKYEKFKVILDGADDETAVDRLRERAVPYMIRNETLASPVFHDEGKDVAEPLEEVGGSDHHSETFLVCWLKETAKEDRLSTCAAVLADCCGEHGDGNLFSSDEELVEIVLFCIYACSRTDEWVLMSSMLARIPGREAIRGGREPPTSVVEVVPPTRGLRKGFMSAFRGAVGGRAGDNSQQWQQVTMAPLAMNVDDTTVVSPRSRDAFGNGLSEALEARLRQAEDHVEAGQLLLQYQVPKPISFFLACGGDVNGSKQLMRILLLKFSNRESAKSDNGWASLWRDLRILQEKAFPFLDKEYLLADLCQGMLKAGKFSLAKNYLKGTGTTILRPEKAEKLVLKAAREYFYSAPDLDSSSIDKAKQCLNLLPPTAALIAEINLIDALTDRLPYLGVIVLPLQFRQMKDSMEVVKMAISTQADAYLNIPEIMELARLLNLNSPDDILAIEAAIARKATAAVDFEFALNMCLVLMKKSYGPIWDLCAALGRGPDFEQMDLDTRKELIGFALGHSDEDSVGELLSAWKEVDLVSSCDALGKTMGKPAICLADYQGVAASISERLDSEHDASSFSESQNDSWWQGGRHALSCVTAGDSQVDEQSWHSFAKEKKKALGFICMHLPWLLDVSFSGTQKTVESVDSSRTRAQSEWVEGNWRIPELPKDCCSTRGQAVALILYALATNDINANDDLVLRLAQEAMSNPISNEGDTVGFGYLLNLSNSHLGADFLEAELERRENYEEAQQALQWALTFGKLQNSVLGLRNPKERRSILIQSSKGNTSSDPDVAAEDFWDTFSVRAVGKLREAKESRRLRKVLPDVDVDVGRFLSGDDSYIQEKIFSHVDSVKSKQENLLPAMLLLAEEYHLDQWQVCERYFVALLEAEWPSEEAVVTEITGYWKRLLFDRDRFSDTVEVYRRAVSAALERLRREGLAHGFEKKTVLRYKRTLVRVLVSLGGDTTSFSQETFVSSDSREREFNASDMLYKVRHSVWQKLCHFAEDLQMPLQCRIFIMELLEAVRNGKVPRQDFWPSGQIGDEDLVISWGRWEAEGGSLESLKQEAESGRGKEKDMIVSSVKVLLALRSTHIISSHWPGWEVTVADLSNPEVAVSFFDCLLGGTSSIGHAKSLRALLEEWESVFGFGQWQGEGGKDDKAGKEDWTGENWSEGWEEEFSENSWAVHTLHSCWKSTLQKLTELGGLREALNILDAALLHPTSVLVTEGEAKDLVVAVGQFNPSAALQLSLLLPYNPPQVHGLQLLEEKLIQLDDARARARGPGGGDGMYESIENANIVNQDLMALVLSSGLLPSAASDPTLRMVFSAFCEFLGYLALQKQELQLSIKTSLDECLVSVDRVPLCAVAFPFFVAELTKSKHYSHAGALILQFMRVHPALATWNATPIALQRYLTTQADGASIESLRVKGDRYLKKQVDCLELHHLRNTMQSLTCRLEEILKSAAKDLLKDMN